MNHQWDYEPVALFISYAREDELLCRQLETHLHPLLQQGLLSLWHDRQILPGANWAQEIDERLQTASIILLLVSPDFLASDYCQSVEVHQALERHRMGTACVVPIILRPADWQETPLGTLQALPLEGKPITSWLDRDEAFDQVTKGIRRVIMALRQLVLIVSSPSDQPFAARLSSDLKTRGITSWFYDVAYQQDTDVSPEESIPHEMQAVSAVLLIASPDARYSRLVKEQLDLAAIYRRSVIVLWIRGDSWEESVPEGWSKQEVIDAREPLYEEVLQEVLSRIRPREALAFPLVPPSHKPEIVAEPRNPYKALRAFLLEDARDFFGRDTLIQQILHEWQALIDEESVGKQVSRLLAVIGPSGSGKSSLVMAGILPRLQRGAVVGSTRWIFLDRVFPGRVPLEALAISLAKNYPKKDSIAVQQLLETDSSRVLQQLVAEIAPSDGKVLLVIDQFEELFAQAVSEKDRLHFLDLLMTATLESRGPLMCILTLRADFFGHVMNYPQLYQCIDAHRYAILPLDLHELREVIEKPATLPDVQLSFEGNLVTDLLVEARGQVGALPLLQFTLDQLYQRRSGRTLTCQAFEEIGGVRGGLLKQAEDTYASLSTDEQRKMTQAAFMRLVHPGASEHDLDLVRRRALLSEFTLDNPTQNCQMQEVIEAFVKARLLTTSQDNGKTAIEVSHEAVLHEWPRLSDWLRTARRDLSIQQTINRDATAWEHHRKSRDRLYRGSQLKEAQEWASRNLPSKQENAFLSASHVSRIQSLVRTFVVCVLLITTTGLAGWFFHLLPPNPTYVTTLSDDGVGSLRWAIANAPEGSTITFDSSLKGSITFRSHDLEIAKNMRIQGPDTRSVSISGGHQSLKVHILPRSSVTISNFVFRDGVLTTYSMLYNEGHLELINCMVSGNTARATNLNDPTQGNGGGIYNTGNLTLTRTSVSGNKAESNGGGIYNTGTLTLNKSPLTGNKAGKDFFGSGGGIYNIGTLAINSSTIYGNTTAGVGGGVYNDCILNNTTDSNDTTCSDGDRFGTLILTNSTVSNNVGDSGGGIYNAGKFTLTSSTVSGNKAMEDGGGIENYSDFNVLFRNSTISGNSTDQTLRGGGGILNDGYGDMGAGSDKSTLTLVDCTVSENTSTAGGGIFSQRSEVILINSTVSENTTLPVSATDDLARVGGGIVTFIGITVLINSTISGNTAYQDGGGIHNQGGLVYIYFSTIVANTANEGGGIVTIDDNTVLSDVTSGRTLLHESILVNNKANSDPNSAGTLLSGGYNLIEDLSTVNIGEEKFPGTDISVSSQDLATIFSTYTQPQNNSGPTKTYALLTDKNNPALDKVPLAYCQSTGFWHAKQSWPITTDQRGKPRPDGKEAMCDIGAYEVQN